MRKSILSALFTLSFFTIVDRVLGFVFKIYLSRELGAETLGVYQVALSFFFVLLTATTSGIPLMVSKSTARYATRGDEKSIGGITASALIVGLLVAGVISLAVFILYKPLGSLFTNAESTVSLLFMMPALLFSAVYSALRGNLWGKSKFFAVSVVEVIEQIARIISCVLLFALGFNKLYMTALSMSIGCFVSMAGVIICFVAQRGKLCSPKGQFAPLIRSALPITVSRAASSVVSSLTAIAVPFLLISTGLSPSQSMAVYGSGVGMALPLLYVPITIVGSLAFVMIPAVSEDMGRGNYPQVSRKIQSSLNFSIVVAALFVPVFSALGENIGLFVYDDLTSGIFLSRAAWILIPLSMENITSSVMNSLDLEMRSFINYIIGSAVTFAVMFAFYGSFDIHILSFSMGLGWSVSTILHIRSIKKKVGFSRKWIGLLIKSALLIFPTSFVAKSILTICSPLHIFARLCISGGVSVLFYGSLSLVFGLVDLDFFVSRKEKKKKFSKKAPNAC